MLPVTPLNFVKLFPDLAADLEEEQVEALLEALLVQEYDAGEALIAEGTHTDSLFLVWDGELNVLIDTPDGEHEIAQRQPGAFLGEVSLMDPGLATATVRSEQGCTALHMSSANLENFWKMHPVIASAFLRELLRTMAVRIRAANVHLGQLRDDEAALV
jgi:CRP-like cAMP-binding protein